MELINAVIENFEKMSLEDKEYVLNILEKHLIESKRERLYERAKEALRNYAEGNVKKGDFEDLLEDLEK